jgi:hypothetical protein
VFGNSGYYCRKQRGTSSGNHSFDDHKTRYQIFEEREHKHGFGLDDWLNAEKELWRDDDLDAPDFSLVVDCPRDSEVTTSLGRSEASRRNSARLPAQEKSRAFQI